MGVRFACQSPHAREASVRVRLRPGVFMPVDVPLRKQCGGHKAGFSVTAHSHVLDGADADEPSSECASAHVGVRVRLCPKRSESHAPPRHAPIARAAVVAVVQDGRATRAWSPDTPAATIAADADVVTFVVTLGHAVPGIPMPNATRAGNYTPPADEQEGDGDAGDGEGEGSAASRRLLSAVARRRVAASAAGDDDVSPAVLRPRSGLQAVAPLSVGLRYPRDDGWLEVSAHGELVAGGVFHEGPAYVLDVHFSCPAWGSFPSVFAAGFAGRQAEVAATIPLANFEPGRFAFQKHCPGWIQEPLGMAVFALFVLGLVGAGVFVYKKRAAVSNFTGGYLPVSQDDAAA